MITNNCSNLLYLKSILYNKQYLDIASSKTIISKNINYFCFLKVLVILGVNGAGKSSLFNILNGLNNFDKGHVSFFGHDLRIDLDTIRSISGLYYIYVILKVLFFVIYLYIGYYESDVPFCDMYVAIMQIRKVIIYFPIYSPFKFKHFNARSHPCYVLPQGFW